MIHAPELPLSPADGLLIELRQCADEGRAVEPLRDRAAAILALPRGDARREWDAAQLYATLEQLPAAEDYGFCEPADEGTLRELRAAGPRRLPVKPDSVVLLDALHGAWLGRCAGCLLGKPLAGWKRERLTPFPETAYIETPPDWLCEVLSPSTQAIDRTDKLSVYAEFGVKYCW